MESKSISIKELIGRVKRHPMLEQLEEDAIIDYAVEFMQIMGIPATFDEKTTILTLNNHKTELPDDFFDMVAVRTSNFVGEIKVNSLDVKNVDSIMLDDIYTDVPLEIEANIDWKTNLSDSMLPVSKVILPQRRGYVGRPVYYRYTTDSFHLSPNKYDAAPFTYKLQGNVLVSSERFGKIEIVYNAMATDDCGMPMIPDNKHYQRALESYIKVKAFTIMFDTGRIPQQVLEHAERDYAWDVGSCSAAFHEMSMDKAESLANMWKALLIRDNEHSRGYSTSGDKEFLRIK